MKFALNFTLFLFLILLKNCFCSNFKDQYTNQLHEIEKIKIDIRRLNGFFSFTFLTIYKFNRNIKLEDSNNSEECFIFDENLKKIYNLYKDNFYRLEKSSKNLSFYDRNIIYLKYLLTKNKLIVFLSTSYLFFYYFNKSKLDLIDDDEEEESDIE